MKALRFAFTGKCSVELQEFEVVPPQENEVLVRTVLSMVSSGTEGIVFSRAFTAGNHWDQWVKYPFIPGYSAAGYVEAVGAGVTKVKPGDRVITRGAHASMNIVSQEKCHKIPDGISFENSLWFAFAKITAMGAHAVQYKLGDYVAVIGAGLIGQFSARWAAANGAAKVIVVDPAKDKLKFFENTKGIVTLDKAIGPEVYTALTELCNGKLPDVVVESTGNAKVFQSALKAVGKFGKLLLMTDTGTPEEQRLCGEMITRCLHIVAAHDPQETADWNESIIAPLFFGMCLDGRINVDNMITHRFVHDNPAEIYRVCLEERAKIMGMTVNWEN